MLKIDQDGNSLKFNIHVQPRASRNQVMGLHGDALKVRIQAPPVEGAANKMCVEVLARALGVPKSVVEIVSGHSARQKRVRIHLPAKNSSGGGECLKKRIHSICELLIPL